MDYAGWQQGMGVSIFRITEKDRPPFLSFRIYLTGKSPGRPCCPGKVNYLYPDFISIMKPFTIQLLGSGNVATQYGIALARAGHKIRQVYSRNIDHAAELARSLGAEPVDRVDALSLEADLVVVALSDHVLEEVLSGRSWENTFIVHTSGSLNIQVLDPFTRHTGVMYPLQSLSKDTDIHFADVPLLIEAADPADLDLLRRLAGSISRKVSVAGSATRMKLHLAAVFCNNFTNHMMAIAAEYAQREGLSFDSLHPLILETARKAILSDPRNAQTGPAVRDDENVLRKHEALLAGYPDVQNLYTFVSDSIKKLHAIKNGRNE